MNRNVLQHLPSASGIYYIKNLINGKTYVGSTYQREGIRNRCRKHRESLRRGDHKNPHLMSAWRLYGEDSFEFGVLEVVLDLDILAQREAHWVRELDTLTPNGYNLELPDSGEGRKMVSEETRTRMSVAHLGKKLSDDHIARAAAGHVGHRHSEVTRARMSAAAAGRKMSDEARAKMRANNRWNRARQNLEDLGPTA